MKKTNNKGFSLVELIIVIAIMAVLVGILAPQFVKYVEDSRESTDIKNVQEMVTSIQVWAADPSGALPADASTLAFDNTAASDAAITAALGNAGLDATYDAASTAYENSQLTVNIVSGNLVFHVGTAADPDASDADFGF